MTVGFYENFGLGEGVFLDDISLFKEDYLHEGITRINIECSFIFRNKFGFDPSNTLEINFDLSTTKLVDFRNLNDIKNNSYVKVFGSDSTWVNGVFEQLIKKLNSLKTSRTLLHKSLSSDVLMFVLLFPLILWIIYHLDTYLVDNMKHSSGIFLTFIYLYVAMLTLYSYRIIYNLMKILYPYIEYAINKKNTWLRRIISTILLGIIGKILYDVIFFVSRKF